MKTHNNTGCSCNCGCGAGGTVLGIIAGVIVAVLFSLGLTPLIIAGIWSAFGIASAVFVYLLVLAVLNSCNSSCCTLTKCLSGNLKCLLAGTFGTLISTLVLASTALEISSIVTAIIVGIATFFLVFLIASLISFLKCLINKQ